MTKRTARIALVGVLGVALLGAGLFLANRPATAPPAAPPKWLEFEPDAAQTQKMAELERAIGPDGKFARQARREPENAKLFMYMAGTSEKDAVVLASLDALRQAYAPRGSKKEKPDRDLEKVLVKRLHSANPAQMAGAFTAAPVALMAKQPEGELFEYMLELARSESPAVRWAALESLDLLPPDGRPGRVLDAFLKATEDTPAFAVRGLRALRQSRPTLESMPEVKERVRQNARRLFASTEPGLRGAALLLLVELDPQAPSEVSEMARKSLGDPHPYLRGLGAAALSVGKLGGVSDIHLLMPLVEDFAEASTTLNGPPALDGTPTHVPANVPGRRLVAESALFSIQRLALGPAPGTPVAEQGPPITWKAPPSLTIGGRVKGTDLVEENAQRMRAWYEREKAKIPRLP